MVIYPIAQQMGYMKEEGIDLRVIFIAPTTSIQAMLGGDVQFTGAGTSALVTIARSNTPLKVVAATNDRVLQWLVTKPDITNPKELKGKRSLLRVWRRRDVHVQASAHQARARRQQKTSLTSTWGRAINFRRCLAADLTRRFLASNNATSRSTRGCVAVFHRQRGEKFLGKMATTDKLIKKTPRWCRLCARDYKVATLYSPGREGTISSMIKFSGVSRQQSIRVYDDIIGTFTRSGAVDDETQRNDLQIIRQVVNTNEAVPNAKGYDFSFALEADRQLNKRGVEAVTPGVGLRSMFGV